MGGAQNGRRKQSPTHTLMHRIMPDWYRILDPLFAH